jgi:lipopolysaccharide export system protein LptA
MWQKRARAALAVLMLAVAIAVFLSLRSRRVPDTELEPLRVDPKTTVEAGSGQFVRTKDGRTIFKLEFERQLTYADGRNVFQDVVITFPDREGRTFRVSGPEARQLPREGKELGDVPLDGGVTMTGDDGLKVETKGASYDETASLVRAPGPVTFSRGRMSGSGVGATYDQSRDILTLLEQAKVTIAPDQAGQGTTVITAGTAQMMRRDRTIRFERAVTVVGSPQSANSDTAVAFLAPKEDLLDRVELVGHASVAGAAEGATALRGMRADRIVLDYGSDGKLLERATLTGSASVDLAAGEGTRTLSGGAIDATLAPGGQVVSALTATNKVSLTLPAEGKTPARTIQSATLKGSGDDAGIRTLAFRGGTTFKEGTARTATSDALDVSLQPGFGAATDARFKGRVVFRDGSIRADAPEAHHDITRDLINLSSSAASPARVVDERVSIDARGIVLTAGSKRLQAKGDVRSVLQPQKADAKDRRTPAMFERDKPVNVTSAQLDYDGDAGRATYTGNARLWQEERSVQGDTLVVDDTQGNLFAKGSARSRLILEEQDQSKAAKTADTTPATAATKKTETIARGDTLTYDNATRKAVYDGHAHFSGPQGDVDGERIELFLDETGRTLERSEAYKNITARFEGGHRATGARLTYYAESERYLMTGTPVRILEQRADGCSETIGASLTFVRSTDTISVVGNEGSRSQTKPGSCGEQR